MVKDKGWLFRGIGNCMSDNRETEAYMSKEKNVESGMLKYIISVSDDANVG